MDAPKIKMVFIGLFICSFALGMQFKKGDKVTILVGANKGKTARVNGTFTEVLPGQKLHESMGNVAFLKYTIEIYAIKCDTNDKFAHENYMDEKLTYYIHIDGSGDFVHRSWMEKVVDIQANASNKTAAEPMAAGAAVGATAVTKK